MHSCKKKLLNTFTTIIIIICNNNQGLIRSCTDIEMQKMFTYSFLHTCCCHLSVTVSVSSVTLCFSCIFSCLKVEKLGYEYFMDAGAPAQSLLPLPNSLLPLPNRPRQRLSCIWPCFSFFTLVFLNAAIEAVGRVSPKTTCYCFNTNFVNNNNNNNNDDDDSRRGPFFTLIFHFIPPLIKTILSASKRIVMK